MVVSDEVIERLERLDIRFNEYGIDPLGISREYLAHALSAIEFMHRRYFSAHAHGLEHIPDRGRAMLVGNHSGGVAVDGLTVLASVFFDKEPPRLVHGMAEKFLNNVPFVSQWLCRTGQFTGLPGTAERMLEDERLLLVFPEGARGTAKLFRDRYSLVHFGTGFVRLALKMRAPIVPFAFLGGGEAVPTIFNLVRLGKLLGVPYIPLTPYLLPIPLPVRVDVYFGEPLVFQGTGTEPDSVVAGYVDQVKERIAGLIAKGQEERAALSWGRRSLSAGRKDR